MTGSTDSRPVKKKSRRLGRRFRNWLIGLLGPRLVRLWIMTVRLRFHGDVRVVEGKPRAPTNGIFVFWHQRMLILAGYFKDSGFRVLISQHGDGEMIARVIEGLGMKPIRGSSTRGGARACLEILREEPGGLNVAITPDGPRGPRHVFQDGAIFLASRTGLPVYPVAVSARRAFQLPTWDGFLLPFPFTRAVLALGAPIPVPADADRDTLERLRAEAEKRLRELTETADRELEALYRKAIKV